MKLPPRIKLGPHTWRFGWHEGPQRIDEHDESSAKTCDGLTDEAKLRITFDKALKKSPASYQAEVVVHETQHAINYVYGITDKSKEEDVAECSARGWLQLIVDNPPFLEYVRALATAADHEDADEPAAE